jgi:DNA-binding response OmpR family regulator
MKLGLLLLHEAAADCDARQSSRANLPAGAAHTTDTAAATLLAALSAHNCRVYRTTQDVRHEATLAALPDLLVIDLEYGTGGKLTELLLWLKQQPVAAAGHDSQAESPSMANEAAAQSQTNGIPVLLLANHAQQDLLHELLQAGADDYLIKPLRRSDLNTRVDLLLRRCYPQQTAGEIIAIGAYRFDQRSGRASLEGLDIVLTQKEFELALLLLRNQDRPLSRAYIQEQIWGAEPELPTRTMDTHISRVRNKLQLRPERGYRLAPVYGYGYQLEQLGGKTAAARAIPPPEDDDQG